MGEVMKAIFFLIMISLLIPIPITGVHAGPVAYPSIDRFSHNTCTGFPSSCTVTVSTTSINEFLLIFVFENGGGRTISSISGGGLQYTARSTCVGCNFEEYYTIAPSLLSNVVITINVSGGGNLISIEVVSVNSPGLKFDIAATFKTTICCASTIVSETIGTQSLNDLIVSGVIGPTNYSVGVCCTMLDNTTSLFVQTGKIASPSINIISGNTGPDQPTMITEMITDPTVNLCTQGVSGTIVGAGAFLIVMVGFAFKVMDDEVKGNISPGEAKTMLTIILSVALAILIISLILSTPPAGGPCG
jgi:hypothetical protein